MTLTPPPRPSTINPVPQRGAAPPSSDSTRSANLNEELAMPPPPRRPLDGLTALRVLRRARRAAPGAPERFRREVEAAARLPPPHIVQAYDADRFGGVHALLM